MLLVKDLMAQGVDVIAPDVPLHEALARMNAAGYRHLPVLDGDKLVGIITDRDLRLAVNSPMVRETTDLNREDVLDNLLVGECMTNDPQCVTSLTPARQVADALSLTKFGAMPVVDDGQLVGLITYIDFLKHFAANN